MSKLRTEWHNNKSLEFIQIRYSDMLGLPFGSKSKKLYLDIHGDYQLTRLRPFVI
jgi:hypothetical protein